MKSPKLINLNEKIFVAGSSGMVGSSVCRMLKIAGYGNQAYDGKILCPKK